MKTRYEVTVQTNGKPLEFVDYFETEQDFYAALDEVMTSWALVSKSEVVTDSPFLGRETMMRYTIQLTGQIK